MASLGHPFQLQRLSRPGSVTAWHSRSGHQPNFAALNTGRHLYSAGRPSRWALAHVLVLYYLFYFTYLHTYFIYLLIYFTYLVTYLLTYTPSPTMTSCLKLLFLATKTRCKLHQQRILRNQLIALGRQFQSIINARLLTC